MSAGNQAWRDLADLYRYPPRSREVQAFERAVQLLLNGLADPSVSGIWIDYADGRREPTWLPSPSTVARERTEYR
jgi:hypothetical protein